MLTHQQIEFIGIVASVLVLISFVSSNMKKVRTINTLGCVLFVIYGVLIHSVSVWFLNGACFILQIYKLVKENKANKLNENQTEREEGIKHDTCN